MTVIGLTGPSGSGKTSVCTAAVELGCRTINADEVYHGLLVPPSRCLDDIASFFGDEVLNEDGTLNRKILGDIVFFDKEKLSALNSISHKYVKEKFRELISDMKNDGVNVVIVDAPTLFESGFDKECDLTVCLLAAEELREDRIINRDSISKDRAKARLAAQRSDQFFISATDHVIYNNGSPDDLKAEVSRLLEKISKGAV